MFVRRVLLGLGGLSLAALVFIAGYAAYPLLHGGGLLSLPGSSLPDAAGDAQMAKYWQVMDLLDRDFFGEKPPAQARTDGAIKGMVESFGDPYTFFVEPQARELERDQLAGMFGGVGANLQQTPDGYLLAPLPGQPAAAAGIQEGDLLVAVDATPVDAAMSVDELLALIRGPVGTEVTLRVRRGQEELSFTITRAEIQTPSIEWRLLESEAGGDPAGGVGYLRQTIFSERSPLEMDAAVAELREQGALRFVWDLRGNPGGLLSAAVAQSDMWLDEGVIVVEERAGGLRKTFEATSGELAAGAPLVLLVDGGSASASEIVAGALHEHGRARLVGQQTYGKGSVQLIHELADQSSLHVTNAQWYTAGGQQISGQGLTPDIVVAEGDDALAVALAALPGVQEANLRNSAP